MDAIGNLGLNQCDSGSFIFSPHPNKLSEMFLFFSQAFPPGYLTYSLCNWFYIQSQEAADNARSLMETYGGKPISCPERDERFWSTVLALVLQARPHEAASLLAIHSHANSRILRNLRQILVALPIASQARTKGRLFVQVIVRNCDFQLADSLSYLFQIIQNLCGCCCTFEDAKLNRC